MIMACFDHLLGLYLLSGLYVQIKSSDPIPEQSDETIPRDKWARSTYLTPSPPFPRTPAPHLTPFSFGQT